MTRLSFCAGTSRIPALPENLERENAVTSDEDRVAFPPAVVVVDPEAFVFLETDELVHHLVAPIVSLAGNIGELVVAVGGECLRERQVVVIQALRTERRVFVERCSCDGAS